MFTVYKHGKAAGLWRGAVQFSDLLIGLEDLQFAQTACWVVGVGAALSPLWCLLSARQAFGGSAHFRRLWRPFGFTEEQRSRCVTQPVFVAALFIQRPRLCLLINGGLCGNHGAGVWCGLVVAWQQTESC